LPAVQPVKSVVFPEEPSGYLFAVACLEVKLDFVPGQAALLRRVEPDWFAAWAPELERRQLW
jgi:hypothetical protein